MSDKELVALMAATIHGACLATPSDKEVDANLVESAEAAYGLYRAVEDLFVKFGPPQATVTA